MPDLQLVAGFPPPNQNVRLILKQSGLSLVIYVIVLVLLFAVIELSILYWSQLFLDIHILRSIQSLIIAGAEGDSPNSPLFVAVRILEVWGILVVPGFFGILIQLVYPSKLVIDRDGIASTVNRKTKTVRWDEIQDISISIDQQVNMSPLDRSPLPIKLGVLIKSPRTTILIGKQYSVSPDDLADYLTARRSFILSMR